MTRMDASPFVKTDRNTLLNLTHMRWIENNGQCFQVCMKSNGCIPTNTHNVCKGISPESYKKLEELYNSTK